MKQFSLCVYTTYTSLLSSLFTFSHFDYFRWHRSVECVNPHRVKYNGVNWNKPFNRVCRRIKWFLRDKRNWMCVCVRGKNDFILSKPFHIISNQGLLQWMNPSGNKQRDAELQNSIESQFIYINFPINKLIEMGRNACIFHK